jgi:signal transduction histidine kinase
MLISISFSAVIYSETCGELERGLRRAELRTQAEELGIPLPRRFSIQPEDLPPRLREIQPHFAFVEDLQAAKEKLVFNLLIINGVILGISALAGYFLAGRTLKPIEKMVEEQKRFVADASHELRTPLTALKTSMEVALRDKKMSLNEAKKVIKSNLEDIDSLQSLSNNLLSLANFQNNGQNLVFEEIDIAGVIKKAHQKILPLAKEKNIDIKINVKKQNILANKESLEQMILIFLDNAVKFTPQKGKVTITTKTKKKHLILEVKDTGIGIAKKDIPYVFVRFYQGDQSRSKSKAAGFGLGLSLAKRIIEIHKGLVNVSSVLNRGTTFTIKLPLKYS